MKNILMRIIGQLFHIRIPTRLACMITLLQIKAARALLDWKQDDLAKAAGLSLPSINNLERGLYSPRPETLEAIRKAFEDSRIEFLKNNGVAIREADYGVRTFSGQNFIADLDQDILSVLQEPEDELLAISWDEKKWIGYAGVSNPVYLEARKQRGWGERFIIPETACFLTSPVSSYRTLPEGRIPPMAMEIYGDRYALIEWDDMRVTIIQSGLIADSHRIMFNNMWEEARPISEKQLERIELYCRDEERI
jgi:transcriptional regulator with XRE-family HTH domain